MNKLPTAAELPHHLYTSSKIRTAWNFISDWLIIFIAAGFCSYYPNPLLYIGAVAMIASRQHALFLLMHEATHGHIAKNRKWNDLISNVFASWPVGFSTERYREHHWIHHQNTNTEKDPDWTRKVSQKIWQFPMSALAFWSSSFSYMFGRGVFEMFFALRVLGIPKKDWPRASLYFSAIAITLTLTHAWSQFFLFWLVPYFTALPFMHRIRNTMEHMGLERSMPLNHSRNIVGAPVEAFFFAPHNGSLHLIHHLYPNIPCYHLSNARLELLKNPEYKAHAHENSSYFIPSQKSAYADLLIKKETA